MCAALAACSGSKPQAPADARRPVAAGPQLMIGQLPDIDVATILAQTKMLSSDQFEGRAPGTPGEEKSVAFLADQFRKVGLKPGNTDGTYVQKVPLVGITPVPAPLVFSKGSERQTLNWKDDVVAWTKHVANTATIVSSELCSSATVWWRPNSTGTITRVWT